MVDREIGTVQSAALAASVSGGETILAAVQAGQLSVDEGFAATVALWRSLLKHVIRVRRIIKARPSTEAPGL